MADIVSVGIDIGTSTTQVVFSRLTMENAAGYFAVPRVSIVDKQVIYKGQVHTTPLKSPVLIDGAGVREIVAREYGRAGFRPADVETGAVIITGETARKENAREVLSALSAFAGDFVVATAGPDLESILAADPDYIFVVLQGSDATDAQETLEKTLLSNPAWGSLRAVQEGRFHTLEHSLYNLKPNARWGEAYEKLADILYP